MVDSIIRQSRHQFGEDKDVFGPRFLKNISTTFQSLYECPRDDKVLSRVFVFFVTHSDDDDDDVNLCVCVCEYKGQDPACVESVAEELCVHYGHHSAAGGHGVGSCGACYGQWWYAGRYTDAHTLAPQVFVLTCDSSFASFCSVSL